MLIIGVLFVFRSFQSTNQTLQVTVEKLADVTADRIKWELNNKESIAYELGCMALFANPHTDVELKRHRMQLKLDHYGFVDGHIVGMDGDSIFDESFNVSGFEYFEQAIKGETHVTKPMINHSTGKISIFIAAPLWDYGNPENDVIGAIILMLEENTLNNIVNSVIVSKNSYVYMIDGEGYTVADATLDSILNEENVEKLANTERSLRKLAAVHGKMRNGESGSAIITIGGKRDIFAYAPLDNNSGWSVAVVARASDFMSGLYLTVALVIIIMGLLIFIASMLARKTANDIGLPIQKCSDQLWHLAAGNLHSEPLVFTTEDETKALAEATNEISIGVAAMITDIQYMLSEMGSGNFTAKPQNPEVYTEDIAPLLDSYANLNQKLSETILNMKEVSHQVSVGSGQLTDSSQGLAEGATEQAGAIEELQATITTVTEQIRMSADEQKKVLNMAMEMEKVAETSNEEMDNLKVAMRRINETSQKIESIISGIEDIASQTNLLSLNASIEAARAGEAGRGFAVVANEIRSLAESSANSAVHTRELIETAIKEARSGDEITEKTAASLDQVIKGLKSIEGNIQEVTEFSSKQVESMNEIEGGITQISDVIQHNSSLAEESSAISQQFSSQAITLEDLIGSFKIEH